MDGKFAPNHINFFSDPELPCLEIRHSIYQKCSFSKHMHDTLSVGAVLNGQGKVFIKNAHYNISKGEVIVILPGEVHACNPHLDSNWEYLMMHIKKDWLHRFIPELKNISGPEALPQPVIKNPSIFYPLVNFYEFVQTTPHKLEKETRIMQILSLIFKTLDDLRPHNIQRSRKPYYVEQIKGYLSENIDQNVSIVQLSKVAKVSPYYLIRSFSRCVGIPPHAYLLQMRINLARKLIRKGLPLVDVAMETGFFDQSHFTKTFKKSVGLTPKKYLTAQDGYHH